MAMERFVPRVFVTYIFAAFAMGACAQWIHQPTRGIPRAPDGKPDVTFLLYEQLNQYRQIFTDGRKQPEDPNPAWWGYSIGHWDRDTFIIETRGFNDKTWLDDSGYPHTEAMRSIEKFHRTNFGHMDLEVIIDDPKAYTKAWSVQIPLALMADTEMIEDVCENEKDANHINAR